MKRLALLLILNLAILATTKQTYAFQTIGESGELIAAGNYRFGVESQFMSGVNITGFVDTPVTDESSLRFHAGAGDTDFYAGSSFKWIPYPDYDQQPAIGGKVGVTIGREGTDNFFAFSFAPLISKKLEAEIGRFTPYVGLPIIMTSYKSETVTSTQLTVGTEFSNEHMKTWELGAEFAANLNKANSYAAVFVTVLLDDIRPAPRHR